jgi:Family of unknown function (DUF6236)
MGEAKRRKNWISEQGRGLVVSVPMEVTSSGVTFKEPHLDLQELRFSLLFWDKLVWPQSSIVNLDSSPDEQFLEQAGILTKPRYGFAGTMHVAHLVAETHMQAFLDLEKTEPGLWALAQGENSFLLRTRGVLEVGRGALVELTRAIPVPDKDVPLEDILNFRTKRYAELSRLRYEIDSLFRDVNNAADKQFELRRHIQQIEAACYDLIKLGREWGFPFRLADLKSCFELRPFAALVAGAGGWELGAQYEMPMIGSLLGVAGATFKITNDFGMRGVRLRASPYRYVYQFHSELF